MQSSRHLSLKFRGQLTVIAPTPNNYYGRNQQARWRAMCGYSGIVDRAGITLSRWQIDAARRAGTR
jgi:hypothetical protein